MRTREDRCDKMAAAVSAGMRVTDTAAAFGVSKPAVHYACKRRGIIPSRVKYACSVERRARIAAAYKEGVSVDSIAASLGLSVSSVRNSIYKLRKEGKV